MRAGYQHLLVGIGFLYLLIILAPLERVGAPLRVAIAGVILIMAVRTKRWAGAWAMPSLAFATVLVAATIIAVISGSATALTCVAQGSTAMLVIAAIAVLAGSVVTSGSVNASTVSGVLSIYLLLGLLFAALHSFFAALITNYLGGVGAHPTTSDTLYFSLVTLTTVGYGDIVPVANVARAIATIEALTGQLYLVSVVAVVVARFDPKPRRMAAAAQGQQPEGTPPGAGNEGRPDAESDPRGRETGTDGDEGPDDPTR